MTIIRPEEPGDIAAVHEINEKAFGQPTEAHLVDSIRDACPDAVSLIAVRDERIVGHIFFTYDTIAPVTSSPFFTFWGRSFTKLRRVEWGTTLFLNTSMQNCSDEALNPSAVSFFFFTTLSAAAMR